MRRARLKRQRGQAMTELALGMLVFITILVFGIHFAEVGYLSMKVTEAASSAMWDSTAYPLHDWPNDADPARNATTRAAADASARYQDLDGRSSKAGGSISQVFTRFDQVAVQCRTGASGLAFDPNPVTSLAYDDNGGMGCRASARVSVLGFPTELMEETAGAWFKERHYDVPGTFRICAVGRAQGGACQGEFVSMLDDWGLSGSQSSNNPLVPNVPAPTTNPAYWQMAGSVFLLTGAGMGIAASDLATSTVMSPPPGFIFGGENAFWLSFMGEPVWVQPLPSEGWPAWPTSPGVVPAGFGGLPYTVSYGQREACFLGREC